MGGGIWHARFVEADFVVIFNQYFGAPSLFISTWPNALFDFPLYFFLAHFKYCLI